MLPISPLGLSVYLVLCPVLQVGDEVPDVAPAALKGAWEATQELLRQRKISAGHDISDGGLAVALLEMAFSGNVGITVHTNPSVHHNPFPMCPCTHLGGVQNSSSFSHAIRHSPALCMHTM